MVSLDVNIRFAHERDIDAITSIYEQAVLLGTGSFEIDPPDEKEMLRRMQQVFAFKAPYLVAELEGQILGFAYASAYRPRAAYRFTVQDSIYVHPECRSVGVGTQLLTSLISECEIRGFSQMIAIIGDSENKASIGLHKHCGFEHVGTLKNVGFKFDRWLDSVLMQKNAIRKPKLTKLIRSTLIETVMDDYKTEYDPEWVLATLNDAKEALENLIAYVEDNPDAVKETLDDGIQDVYAKLNYAYNSAKDGPEALMTMDDDDLVAFPIMLPFKHGVDVTRE